MKREYQNHFSNKCWKDTADFLLQYCSLSAFIEFLLSVLGAEGYCSLGCWVPSAEERECERNKTKQTEIESLLHSSGMQLLFNEHQLHGIVNCSILHHVLFIFILFFVIASTLSLLSLHWSSTLKHSTVIINYIFFVRAKNYDWHLLWITINL